MRLHLLVMLLSGLTTMALVPLVKWLASAFGALDYPAARRKIHRGAVARLGGIAIFVPTIAVTAANHWWLAQDGEIARGAFLALFGGSLVIFALGLYDDIQGADARTKFAVQFAVATLAYAVGLQVMHAPTPFGGTIDLGLLGFVVTVFWLVGMTNGMNLLDGVDGLAAGIGAIGALTLVVVSGMSGQFEVPLAGIALFGSLLGFLVFNSHPASIFLGDSGALFIGFFLAALSMAGRQKGATAVALIVPIIALGIPVFDTTLAFVRRLLRGTHPFQGDRLHLHHRLLALGFSQRKVVLVLYAFSAALAFMAILMTNVGRMSALPVLLCMAAVVALAVRRLDIAEIGELVGFFKHGERRRRPPRYRSLMVRNSLPLIQKCKTLPELNAHLENIRDCLDLTTLRLRFAPGLLAVPPNAASEIVLADPGMSWEAPREPEWTCQVDVFCEMHRFHLRGGNGNGNGNGGSHWCGAADKCRFGGSECRFGRGRAVGELQATKPAWKTRRKSENDEELLQLLADGLGQWVATALPLRLLSKPRLLIADDDAVARLQLGRILGNRYELIEARDGAEAIARARETLPDLVLLDLKMPRVDGYSVCQALKADVRTQRMPIIMLTALTDAADKVRGIDMGADDYITKPFDSRELMARVQMVLRRAYS